MDLHGPVRPGSILGGAPCNIFTVLSDDSKLEYDSKHLNLLYKLSVYPDISTQVPQQEYLEVESALNRGTVGPNADAMAEQQEDDGSCRLVPC